ncbi:unnamed protein product [Trifolium pratense]|uniref:Uncharacterized protein n=1 Tax=Trifolium pratense TaxID=57577 RepID=A0ACB0IE24_TRIPR|nr:unnamed protein product [Trifolium pratense]
MIVSRVKAGDPVSCNNNRRNYTVNSTYDTVNFSYGQDPDKAYAIGLCRRYLNPNQWLTNINNSFFFFLSQTAVSKSKRSNCLGW